MRLPCGCRSVLVSRSVFSRSCCCGLLLTACEVCRFAGSREAALSFCPKSMRSFSGGGGGLDLVGDVVEAYDPERWCGGGIGFFSVWACPRRIGVTARICSVCFWGVAPSLETLLATKSLEKSFRTYILAFRIQSKSSSPSSGPPGPPTTGLKSRGRHSTPSSVLLAASSRCISSTFVFSSVATS